ncbi:MAG: PilZ domain-containing protein [Gammaproteobacteria bacterium]|nr:PilZ domain-containing protein [Gammaproteobacteria bacterium]
MLDYSEKRNFIRLPVDCPAKFRINGSDKLEKGEVKNISGGGMVLHAQQDIPQGTQISVAVQTNSKALPPLVATVDVVRSEPEPNREGYVVTCSIDKILPNEEPG